MSFDPRQHGSPFFTPFQPLSLSSFGTPFTGATSLSEETATQIATLQAKLNKKLGPEYVSQRPGPSGGPKLTYAEGWKIINLANEVFGFNGWSSSVVNLTTDFVDWSEEARRFNVGVTAIVRVMLKDGAYHEDVGYGMLENAKSKAAALDKCKKEAVTDALKRTLRNFGNLLGNCLYDKTYAQEVVKIKVPAAKFDASDLYRRPEFEDGKPALSVPAVNRPVIAPETTERPPIKREPPETPITYIPRHLRHALSSVQQQTTPVRKAPAQGPNTFTSSAGPDEQKPSPQFVDGQKPLVGLHTPVQTPAQRPSVQPRAIEKSKSPVPRSPLAERKPSLEEMPPPRPPYMNAGADASANGSKCLSPVVTEPRSPPPEVESEDADGFPLSTQDGAFFATVDLGEGDLGRPIDFEEGMGGVSMMDGNETMVEEVQLQVAKTEDVSVASWGAGVGRPVGGAQLGAGAGSVGGAGSSRVGQLNGTTSTTSSTPVLASSSTSNSVSNPSSTSTPGTHVPTSSKRPENPSMGGSHFPPGTKPSTHTHPQPPKPPPPAIKPTHAQGQPQPPNGPSHSGSHGSGTGNGLKRSVDMMQGSTSSSSAAPIRTPIQGMGLAQRHQHQHQYHPSPQQHPPHPRSAVARWPADMLATEGGDPKRMKR